MQVRRTATDVRFAPLLAAVRSELQGDSGVSPVALDDDAWRSLLARASWHRLSTVLARQLVGSSVVPGWVSDELSAAQFADVARSLMIGDARDRVFAALHRDEVPVLALKGSALIETVYPDAGWRDMGDVDLLVPVADHERAVATVRALGYHPLPGVVHDPTTLRHHDPKLVGADGVVPVEVHRFLRNDVDERFDVDELWTRSTPSAAGTHGIPAPHDLLIHACLHFVAGCAERSEGALAGVRDIAWIAARGGVDWEQLRGISRRFGVDGRVQLALGVADHLGLLADRVGLASAPGDATRAARFATARVLTDRPHLPVGRWGLGWSGLCELVRWSRWNLSDRAAGEMPESAEIQRRLLVGRSGAVWRGGLSVLRAPRPALADLRLGGWLRTLR